MENTLIKNKYFEENFKIGYSEKDFNLVLKPSFMLQFLQNMATDNADALGFGYDEIVKHNLGWFLLKYHMEFSDYPENLEELTVKTEPRGYNKLFAMRDFEMLNGEKTLGRAISAWTLVDITTKSMTGIGNVFEGNPYMKPHEKRETDLNYTKIKPLARVDKEHVFEIRYDDIDVNTHVNNSNYIIWAFENLDIDFRSSKKLKTLDMVFKKEIKYGSKVLSQVEINGNITNHVLKNAETGEDICLVLAEWTDRK